MGCGSSKTAKNVISPLQSRPKNNIIKVNQKVTSCNLEKEDGNTTKQRKSTVSQDSMKCSSPSSSLSSHDNIRIGKESAKTSVDCDAKVHQREQSANSADSGLGDYEEDRTIITEKSDLSDHNINLDDRPPTPELIINGSKLQRNKLSSSKTVLPDINNHKNSLILSHNSKIDQNQVKQIKGGMAFDIVLAPDTNNKKRCPDKLPKLDRRKNKRKELTKEEIEAKQQAAEERRKNHEEKLVAKAAAYKEREKKAHEALQKFAEAQSKHTREKLTSKLEQSEENRKAHLESLRRSIREKERRARKVRQTKQQMLAVNESKVDRE